MNTDHIKELRSRTGLSMDLCAKALEEAGGDVEKAIELLQRKGTIKAADKAGRIATAGKVFHYTHGGGIKISVVEINCETDFAARSPDFREFGENLAMHIVASSPLYLDLNAIPLQEMNKQYVIFYDQVPKDKEDARDKIVEGKMKKWVSEVCLMEQESVTQSGKTIEQLRVALVLKLGENVTVRRFFRWELGEGLDHSV